MEQLLKKPGRGTRINDIFEVFTQKNKQARGRDGDRKGMEGKGETESVHCAALQKTGSCYPIRFTYSTGVRNSSKMKCRKKKQ